MSELIQARDVIEEFLQTQQNIKEMFNLDNQLYLDGLTDAVRIINKIINKEIERQAEYYENQDR